MKKRLYIAIILFASLPLVACEERLLSQRVDYIEIGTELSFNELVTTKEGVSGRIESGSNIIMELGEIDLRFSAVKGEQTKYYTFTYKVIDTSKPIISLSKEISVIQGDQVDLKEYLDVIDNSGELLKDNLIYTPLDTSEPGSYEASAEVTDSSGNHTIYNFKYTVQPAFTVLEIGKTYEAISNYLEKESKIRFTLNGVRIQESVYPINPSGYFYSYYANKVGEKYFVIDLTIENFGGAYWSDVVFQSDFGIDSYDENLKSLVIFDNQYEFAISSSWINEAKGDLDYFWGLNPFEKVRIYWMTTIPDQVYKMNYDLYLPIMGKQFYFKNY